MPPREASESFRVDMEREGKRVASLAGERIFFGHQSVGNNILSGLAELFAKGEAAPFPVTEFDPFVPRNTLYGLVHARIGKNGDPYSKIAAFEKLLLADGGKTHFDIVFFKFCYVDFYEDTPVERVFDAYKAAVARIQAARPGLVIAHVTVPLTNGKPSWKQRLKRLLGRREIEYLGNIQRNRFNDLLRAEYGRGPFSLFDLAKAESTRSDGSRATFTSGGRTYEVLADEYTDDGGHLNARGRNWVAGRFLEFLLRAAEGRH